MIKETLHLLNLDVKPAKNGLGVNLPENYTQAEWINDFERLRSAEKVIAWVKGDLFCYAASVWGREFVRSVGLTTRELKVMCTARLFPHEDRRDDLSFSHHIVCFTSGISSLTEAKNWLGQAAMNEWSAKDLETRIRQSKHAILKDLSVRPLMNRDYVCFQEATTFVAKHPIEEQGPDWLRAMRRRIEPLVQYAAEIDATMADHWGGEE